VSATSAVDRWRGVCKRVKSHGPKRKGATLVKGCSSPESLVGAWGKEEKDGEEEEEEKDDEEVYLVRKVLSPCPTTERLPALDEGP